jgi:hypothetical protein
MRHGSIRLGFEMFGFAVYALSTDGSMMEGVSGEAATRKDARLDSALCGAHRWLRGEG